SLHTFKVGFEIDDELNSTLEQNSNFIRNIKNLKLCSYKLISKEFLNCFYSNCNLISLLHIDIDSSTSDENESIRTHLLQIINSQRNLKKIIFESNEYLLNTLKYSNCSNTLKTITL